jgi:hypothetical protein
MRLAPAVNPAFAVRAPRSGTLALATNYYTFRLRFSLDYDWRPDRIKRPPVKLAKMSLLRAARLSAALMLGYAGAAQAALGGLPEQFSDDGMTVVSSMSSTASNYVMRDTTLATGTHVREYVSGSGVVFALSWDGPVLPNLQALLGKYFDTMVSESAKTPRAGRSPLAINLPEVVINSGGHMRAFEGSAWIPADLPPGFGADQVQ